MPLIWHGEAALYGFNVRAFFFSAELAEKEPDLAERVLPLPFSSKLKTLFTESDRKNFTCGEIIAQPDAVFEHGKGLISVEYKSVGGQSHAMKGWKQSIRLKDMLQCLIGGYTVAQTYQRPTACVLRYHNVCYLLVPEPKVIEVILQLVPMAKMYHSAGRLISSSNLAQFSVDKIRSIYPESSDQRAEAGRVAHETLLRR